MKHFENVDCKIKHDLDGIFGHFEFSSGGETATPSTLPLNVPLLLSENYRNL